MREVVGSAQTIFSIVSEPRAGRRSHELDSFPKGSEGEAISCDMWSSSGSASYADAYRDDVPIPGGLFWF